jgi:hypothetical protein
MRENGLQNHNNIIATFNHAYPSIKLCGSFAIVKTRYVQIVFRKTLGGPTGAKGLFLSYIFATAAAAMSNLRPPPSDHDQECELHSDRCLTQADDRPAAIVLAPSARPTSRRVSFSFE